MSANLKLDPFDDVVAAYSRGEMVIIVDSEDRENEGDIAIASDLITKDHMSFMMREARGLICVSLPRDRAEALNLPLQVRENRSQFGTRFTVSVDLCTNSKIGVTAKSRAETTSALVNPESQQQDFVSPGHIFPLVADPSGVLGRQGQTEGSLDLARIAGRYPSGVICEILQEDGSMARGASLRDFADKHKLLITSVEEIFRYRVRKEVLVRRNGEAELSTDYGKFNICVFQDDVESKEHLALVYGDIDDCTPLVRLHSECLTGDVFSSRRCDCGEQLASAMQMIVKDGKGVVLYLRQEGRGIGFANKLKAYALQDTGLDTVEANLELGFQADERSFATAGQMLFDLGIKSIKLLTNNPAKVEAMQRIGIKVEDRIPLLTKSDEFSKDYLNTKRTKLGHFL